MLVNTYVIISVAVVGVCLFVCLFRFHSLVSFRFVSFVLFCFGFGIGIGLVLDFNITIMLFVLLSNFCKMLTKLDSISY
jgi:hypothetical protein